MTGQLFRNYLLRFDRYVGRSVILLVDNASSHIFDDLSLTYVKIRFLPPNTTSKLQPLDAGIISAFKKHYRRIQIRHDLEAIEKEKDPYQIDQLTAMRWSRRAWNILENSTFVNCWKHTGILGLKDDASEMTSAADEADDAELQEEYDQFVQVAKIQDAMSLNEFLKAEFEEGLEQEEMTDEEILQLVQETEEDLEQQKAEHVINAPSLCLNYSMEESLMEIAKVKEMLEFAEANEWIKERELETTSNVLRKLQRKFRETMMTEKAKKEIQRSIVEFFPQSQQN